jgi:Zn-finger nucleic acid-binding protein
MTLQCPKCQAPMRTYERSGVTLERCTECRGVFLDRGELEHLVDAEGRYYEGRGLRSGDEPRGWLGDEPRRGDDEGYLERRGRSDDAGRRWRDDDSGRWRDDEGYGERRGRRGFLDDLLDFGCPDRRWQGAR